MERHIMQLEHSGRCLLVLSDCAMVPSAPSPQAFSKLGLLTPRGFLSGKHRRHNAPGPQSKAVSGPDLGSLELLSCKCWTTRLPRMGCEGTSSFTLKSRAPAG